MLTLDESAISDIVTRMGDLAATTQNDRVSVELSRVANRLAHCGGLFEENLTKREIRIVTMFVNA